MDDDDSDDDHDAATDYNDDNDDDDDDNDDAAADDNEEMNEYRIELDTNKNIIIRVRESVLSSTSVWVAEINRQAIS